MERWTNSISAFAESIGLSADQVTEQLKKLVGEPSDEALGLLESEEFTPFEEIKTLFGETPVAKLRQAVSATLRKKIEVTAPTASAASAPIIGADILPQVPDDEAWLSMLQTGGILKVEKPQVISGVRAALASRTGLYELPKSIAERMEVFAESLDEPVPAKFFELREQLTRRTYADIFAAIPGLNGQFITDRRRKEFLDRVDQRLWPSLQSFYDSLQGWTQSWQAGFNPAMLAMTMMGGAQGVQLPPGMMQPPATDGLQDAASSVVNEVNGVFSGLGIPVAMALAYDALQIKAVLEEPTLPMQVGAANREQMLKMFGVDVQADYVRLERNITKFALGVMEFQSISSDQELGYLVSLLNLGSQIPWDKLATVPRRTAVRGTMREA